MSFQCPKNCPNRCASPNCHTTCTEYLADKIMRAMADGKRRKSVELDVYQFDAINKNIARVGR